MKPEKMKTKGVSEQRAVQAWELMTNGWTETEFERRLNQVKIQDKYPEIKEIVAKIRWRICLADCQYLLG